MKLLRAQLAGAIVLCGTLQACVSLPPLSQFVVRPNQTVVLKTNSRTLASGVLINEEFEVDRYRVQKVKRGGFVQRQDDQGSGGYSYRVEDGNDVLDAKCKVQGQYPKTRKLECQCTTEDGTSVSLSAQTVNLAQYTGEMKIGAQTHALRSVGMPERFEQFLHPGFVVGEPLVLGAQIGEPGELWISSEFSNQQRALTVCLGAGLMLYRPMHARPAPINRRSR